MKTQTQTQSLPFEHDPLLCVVASSVRRTDRSEDATHRTGSAANSRIAVAFHHHGVALAVAVKSCQANIFPTRLLRGTMRTHVQPNDVKPHTQKKDNHAAPPSDEPH